jgi:signal transduction histidine kinase
MGEGVQSAGTAIQGNDASQLPKEQATVAARLDVARRSLDLIKKTSDQIKGLHRAQSPPEYGTVDVAAMVSECAGQCREEIQDLLVDTTSIRGPASTLANQEMLEGAVNEVLANACRELRHQQVARPELRIEVSTTAEDIVVQVRDNGLPAEKPLIDLPFEEDASLYAKLGLGTGLGLAVVRETFRIHGGDCSLIANHDEQGTRVDGVTFKAWLPKRVPPPGEGHA